MICYGVLYCAVAWFVALWSDGVRCGVLQCHVVWSGVMWCGLVSCGVVWCGVVADLRSDVVCDWLWCVVLCGGVVCCQHVMCPMVCCVFMRCGWWGWLNGVLVAWQVGLFGSFGYLLGGYPFGACGVVSAPCGVCCGILLYAL